MSWLAHPAVQWLRKEEADTELLERGQLPINAEVLGPGEARGWVLFRWSVQHCRGSPWQLVRRPLAWAVAVAVAVVVDSTLGLERGEPPLQRGAHTAMRKVVRQSWMGVRSASSLRSVSHVKGGITSSVSGWGGVRGLLGRPHWWGHPPPPSISGLSVGALRPSLPVGDSACSAAQGRAHPSWLFHPFWQHPQSVPGDSSLGEGL